MTNDQPQVDAHSERALAEYLESRVLRPVCWRVSLRRPCPIWHEADRIKSDILAEARELLGGRFVYIFRASISDGELSFDLICKSEEDQMLLKLRFG